MRRIAHSLSLLLVGMTLLTVLSMALLVGWNVRRGFNDYLDARERDRLARFVLVLEQRVLPAHEHEPALEQGSDRWEIVLRDALRAHGQGEWAHAGRPPPELASGAIGPAIERRPPPGGPEGFGARMSLVDPRGQPLAGPTIGEQPHFDAAIRRGGRVVAIARLRRPAPAPDAIEASFVARQYSAIAVVAAGLMLVAGLLGHRAAARWVAPLLALQRRATEIADGHPQEPLDERRPDEIGDLMRDMNRMSRSLHALEAARRRWMAEIAHELRGPLAVLRGEVEALLDGVRPWSEEAVRSLHDETLRLSRLVDDLHLLAMSELRAMPTHRTDAEPATLLRSAVRRHEERAMAAGHAITVELEPAVQASRARWDPQRIAQLLDNLLANSVRYTEAPGRIALRARMASGAVVIDLEDSAPGVAEAERALIFESLYRVDRARSGEGTGLGLAIAQAIVAAHGGQIEARDSALGGLGVRVTLPLDEEASRA